MPRPSDCVHLIHAALEWTLNANLAQAATIEHHDSHLEASFGDSFAALREAFETSEDEAGNRAVVRILLEGHAVTLAELCQGEGSLNQQGTIRQLLNRLFLVDVELVANLPDDLL